MQATLANCPCSEQGEFPRSEGSHRVAWRDGPARRTSLKPLHSLSAPLRHRSFRLLWSAQILSELGDWAGRLALAILVAERTGSTTLTALVTSASVLPYLGPGQLFAVWTNRFPRRSVIIVSDLSR